MTELLRRGAKGNEVREVQAFLNAEGYQAGAEDGVFGAGTEAAVERFQTAKGLTADGIVGPGTRAAMGLAPAATATTTSPVAQGDLAARCLALIGSFETGQAAPKCFSGLSGNFDGQGLSFGALQWCLGQGSLQPLLTALCTNHPDVVDRVFGPDAAAFRAGATGGTRDQQVAWATTIQDSRHRVVSPWKDYFAALGATPEYQAIQVDAAGAMYRTALDMCRDFGLVSQRAVALMFGIRVQNGSISSAVEAQIKADFAQITADGAPADETPLLRAVATRRAAVCKAQWVEDVRTRLLTIAEGSGTVHGIRYDLAAQYGITLDRAEGL
ncbi:peptidoglycan-binding domain-containing protein [Azospirillum halopraeferens]|uniref:peptidoglycan-binding domain-containing protein n=1 Tax=Azospirillum halopraeferens TaxID=34010 RepID=UPI000406A928|nr:peptidoglycan-binding domain-containing protein [Azospirillum halopraeferens]